MKISLRKNYSEEEKEFLLFLLSKIDASSEAPMHQEITIENDEYGDIEHLLSVLDSIRKNTLTIVRSNSRESASFIIGYGGNYERPTLVDVILSIEFASYVKTVCEKK